ncbi:MAG: hypothetical protein RL358_601 [Pseudomonadota bacterium]|jgi:IS4 transposase
MRSNAKFEVLATRAVVANSGVLSDETIAYSGTKAAQQGLSPVRRIVFRDETLQREFVFTTNRFDWDAALVAQIYKQRWQVELFFKWIKQNLKLKRFVSV